MNKNRRRQLPLWPFILVVIVAGIILLNQLKPTENDTLIISGAGYQSICTANKELYLVEAEGNIFTVDWETGEKTHYFSAPKTVSWVSSPDMTALYHIEAGKLYKTDISTGAATALNAKNVYPMEIEIVTENYILFRQDNRFAEYAIMCLNLKTMESSCILSANETTSNEKTSKNVVVVAGEDDKAYAYFSNDSVIEYPDQSKYWIEKWDLNTCERTELVETTEPMSFLESGTTYDEYLYYRLDNTLWRVPVDGSGNSEYILDLWHKDWISSVFLTTDGSLLYDTKTTVERMVIVCRYDLNTSEITPFCALGNASIKKIRTDGNHVAIWYNKNSKEDILLTGLPTDSMPSMTEQLYAALPSMMMALELIETEAEADKLSIGQPILIYRVENSDPIRGDTDIYPIYKGDNIVALAYPCLHETKEYTFTLGKDYAKELNAFLHESNAKEIALVEDRDGIHCVTDSGEQYLLSEHYTELTSKITYLTEEEISSILRPFNMTTRQQPQ